MFGMLTLGAATGGHGAFASWGFAAHNMYVAGSTIRGRDAQLQGLVTQFPELQAMVS